MSEHVLPAGNAAVDELNAFIAQQKIDRAGSWRSKLPKPPQLKLDDKSSWTWRLQTNVGTLDVKLLTKTAPMHVSSTAYLTLLGFYDGLLFHRVITGFMAQGGCPLGTGTGEPGYRYNGEFDPKVRHDKPGLLSMANSGPNTDGSQFFLTFVATPWLDGKHTIFGEVVSGQDVLKELEKCGSQSGRTASPLKIEKATLIVKAG